MTWVVKSVVETDSPLRFTAFNDTSDLAWRNLGRQRDVRLRLNSITFTGIQRSDPRAWTMVFTRFLALAFINLICSFVAADDEYFTVKRNNLKDFRDRFAVPAGERVPKDFCSRFNAGKYLRSKTDCRCPLANPTFGYYENAWLCFNNTKLKKQQGM